jgi:nitrogenase-stabilizing/protective protein
MATLQELRQLTECEDFFRLLGVPWDEAVLRVHRLHVLRRFALEMELIDRQEPTLAEQPRLLRYADALRRAHELFTRSSAREQKLFRVFHGNEQLVALSPRRR